MKLNLEKQFIDMDGEPAVINVPTGFTETGEAKGYKEVKYTVGYILKGVLNHKPAETKDTPELMVKKGNMILQIIKGESPDFTVEDLAMIKQLASAAFNPLIVAQLNAEIEAK